MNNPLHFVRLFGFFLVFIGFIIIILIFLPAAKKEFDYQSQKDSWQEHELIDSKAKADQLEQNKEQESLELKPAIIIPKSFDFSLVIPKIGVNSQVFKNISSSDEQEYLPILKKGVAHGRGSVLPNESGPVFIFAHSTDSFYNIGAYNAEFFLLNKLVPGDEAIIFFQDKKYKYKVLEKKIVKPGEINGEVKKLNGPHLVLQTCWPPGTTLKRLLVIAGLQ